MSNPFQDPNNPFNTDASERSEVRVAKKSCWDKTKIVGIVLIAVIVVIQFITLLLLFIKLNKGICFRSLPY